MKIRLNCPICNVFLCMYDLTDIKSNPKKCPQCKWVYQYDGNSKTWEKAEKYKKIVESSGKRFKT